MRFSKKKIVLLGGIIILSASVYGFEPVSTEKLLISYLENDNDLKTNVLDARKAQLSLKTSQINNGFDITLSTGTVSLSFNEAGTDFSIKPSVKAELPQFSNLSVTASSEFGISNNKTDFENTKINASIDIISTTGLERKITLLKAERSLIEANRKLQTQVVNSEKSFYTDLKTLLNSTSNLINSEKTLYTNQIDFEKIKTQGYSSSSSIYRLAQMKVLSSEHEIQQLTRSLLHDYIVFYKKCGYDITLDENIDFYELIPKDITEVEPLDIHSYDSDLYTEIESAVWTNKINTMQRKAKSNFSLGANGGVTFNNQVTKSTTIDTGLYTVIGGLGVEAGVSFPIATQSMPAFTFSAIISPNTYRLNSITKESDSLSEQQELLTIENARSNYATKIVDTAQSLADMEWTKKSDKESFEMYQTLESDLAKWFKEGFVTESEYYSAKANVQSYKVKQVINAIDYIIYNDNIIMMFVQDEQEK